MRKKIRLLINAVKTTVLSVLLCCCGCSSKEQSDEQGKEIIFNKEKQLLLAEAAMFKEKIVIPLETTDNSLIGDAPSIRVDGDNFFVFHTYKQMPILRFNEKGHFLNKIGSIGQGPNEFTTVNSVSVNAQKKRVEILSGYRIFRFEYDGTPLEHSLSTRLSVMSFVNANDFYWLYVGNNKASPFLYRLFQTDEDFKSYQKYLPNNSNLLPFSEENFGGNDFITFREIFYNKVYRIMGDSLIQTYTIRLPDMELPNNIHNMEPYSVIGYLKQRHHALIRCYLENQDYVYFWIEENNFNEKPIHYHWIIDKAKDREMIVRTEIIPGSYLMSPQLLTKNNKLYFIGYPYENNNQADEDFEENPSVVIVDISKFN